jgi:fumarate reductase flavoprotein subunit
MAEKKFFEIPPPPISAEEIEETLTADVVVVGAGTSGKAAALSAAQAGAQVIQIDKHTTFRWGGGHIAAMDSRLQKKLGIEVDKDDVCLQLMKWAGNKPDQRFYRLWAHNSGAVMDWLMDMSDAAGIETRMYQWPRPAGFDLKTEYYPEYPVCHWQSYNGSRVLNHSLLLNCVQEHALKLGVDIRYQTRAIQLIRQGRGRVTGVIARDKRGKYVQFNAHKAVVLCTGDYGNNPDMMEKYCSIAADVARTNNIYMNANENLKAAPEPLNTGDGHQMAMWIGAVMEPPPHAPVAHATVAPLGNGAFLRVNINGVRYENEDVPGQSIANSLVRQPGKKVWQVFDSKWEDELPRMGVGLGKFYEVNEVIRARVEEGALKGDTLEKLARKIDVPVKTFKATINSYNKLAKMGKDSDFGKYTNRLTTIEKPPFFVALIQQEFLVVLGGLNTNIRFQPLDADGNVIPGLYLAGNTVGNRFAVDYPTMCPGLTHGMAYTTGRIAGLNAAAEKV